MVLMFTMMPIRRQCSLRRAGATGVGSWASAARLHLMPAERTVALRDPLDGTDLPPYRALVLPANPKLHLAEPRQIVKEGGNVKIFDP
ncbi:unnamed protein product, partial [Iphiclides podalirius]